MKIYDNKYLFDILSKKLRTESVNWHPGIQDGLTGSVLLFYSMFQQSGNSSHKEFADDLLEQILDKVTCDLSLEFERGLTGIGWSIEYFAQQGFITNNTDYILEDFDVLFRKQLMLRGSDPNILIEIGLYFAERARGKSFTTAEQKRMKRNMLLCLNSLDNNSEMIYTLDERMLLHYFSVLIDFQQFNVFRYKTNIFLSQLLLVLQQRKENLCVIYQIYAARLLMKLYSCSCINESISELSKELYDFFQEKLGSENAKYILDPTPCLTSFDGQLFLTTKNQDCIALCHLE